MPGEGGALHSGRKTKNAGQNTQAFQRLPVLLRGRSFAQLIRSAERLEGDLQAESVARRSSPQELRHQRSGGQRYRAFLSLEGRIPDEPPRDSRG
jgi:hypothetical protein